MHLSNRNKFYGPDYFKLLFAVLWAWLLTLKDWTPSNVFQVAFICKLIMFLIKCYRGWLYISDIFEYNWTKFKNELLYPFLL
jgi:hypothetical protein